MSPSLTLPRLQGGDLVLRRFTRADSALVAETGTDPLIPLITTVPRAPAGADSIHAFIDRQNERSTSGEGYSFVVADAVTDVGLGQIGLWPRGHGRASIGYWVAPTGRRRGVATRASRIITEWGLTLPGLYRMEVCVEPRNEASWHAAEAVGYVREGLLRSWQIVGVTRRDMWMYSRLNTDETLDSDPAD